MTAFEIEEKIDVLYFVTNSIQTDISYLESASCNCKYGFYIAQLEEMHRNLTDELIELQRKLDKSSKEELQEAMNERIIKNEYFNR